MNEGFILSNKYRKAVFDAFASGETRIEEIAKRQRIVPVIARKVLHEFVTEGILEQHGSQYRFTKEGEKLVQTLHG